MYTFLKPLLIILLLPLSALLSGQPFDFTFTVTNCNEVAFTITGGVPVAQNWDFGDGDQDPAASPTHYYGIAGTFNACLTASDGVSTQVVCKTVTINNADCCAAAVPVFTDRDNCCFDLALDQPVNQFFTGVRLKSASGNLTPSVGFDASTWGLPAAPTANEIHLNYTAGTHLPAGLTQAFRFCFATAPTAPETLEVEWLIGPEVICRDTVELTCTVCRPEGPTFSTVIEAKENPQDDFNYEETGHDILFDPTDQEFLVFGVTELLDEIGVNGNIITTRLDACGEQLTAPVITGETVDEPYNVVNVKAVDVSGRGFYQGNASNPYEYLAIATIRKGTRQDYLIVLLQEDGTIDLAAEEMFESTPDETINDIFFNPVDNTLGVVGTRQTLPGSGPVNTYLFVARFELFASNTINRLRREFHIDASGPNVFFERTRGEAITWEASTQSWYVTGQTGDRKMFLMQLDTDLNELHTEVVDVDGNPNTEESGTAISVTPFGEILVAGAHLVNSGTIGGNTRRTFLTTFRLPLLPQCDNVKLNQLYTIPNGGVPSSIMARPQVQGGGLLYTIGGTLNLNGFVNGNAPEASRAFVLQTNETGEVRWLHRYNQGMALEKLIEAEEGFAMVGRSSRLKPTSSGPFMLSTNINDIWTARIDPNGILPDCDCFDPLMATVDAPSADIECRVVTTTDISENLNFRVWASQELPPLQEFCSGPCGTGGPGNPCPNNDCSYISGVKFEDTNGDGLQDPFEPNLCGWDIELVDTNTGLVIKQDQTNSAGFYAFSNLPAGNYFVREVNQACWRQTFPDITQLNLHPVNTTGTSYHFNLNFGNTIDIDCATDKATRLTQLSSQPECVHAVEIDNNLCLDLQRVHLRTTNGVTFGNSTPKSGYQYCQLYPAQPTEICIESTGGGAIPRANAQQLLDFALTDICSYGQIPQSVIVDYHVDLPCSFDKVVCSDTLVTECPVLCPELCTGVRAHYTPSANTEEGCCYDIYVDNTRPDIFTQVNIRALGGVTIANPVITDPNWFYLSQSASELRLIQTQGNQCPNGGLAFLPVGNYSPVTICLDDVTAPVQSLVVEFPACNGDICRDTLIFECPVPKTGCADITRDTFYCDDEGIYKYEFDFVSCWDKDIKSLTVDHLLPVGATVTPSSIAFTPPVTPGGTGTGVLCFDDFGMNTDLEFQLKFFEDSCCFCLSDTLRFELPECPCDGCEDLTYDTRFIGTDTTCCWAIDIDNPCLEDMKSLELKWQGGISFQTITAGPGWFFQNVSTSHTRFQPLLPPPGTTPIPTGPINNKIEFCLTTFGGAALPLPQILEVNWIDMMDEVVCADSLFFDCTPPPPDTCLVIVGDTIVCLPDGTYEYRWNVVNESNVTATHVFVHTSYTTPAGGVINPAASYSFPVIIPPFAPPVAMQPINIGNVSPGDQFCLVPSIYNTITNPPNGNFCCHADTTCVLIPECEPVMSGCCDEQSFFGALSGYTLARSGTTVTLANPLLGPCMTVDVYWGDGASDLAVTSAMFPISHTYVPGTTPQQLCVVQRESDPANGIEECWLEERCFDLPDDEPLASECEPCGTRLWWREIESGGTLAIFDLEPHQGDMIYCGSTGGSIAGYPVTNVGRYDGVDHFDMQPPAGYEIEYLLSHPQGLFATATHRTAGVPDGNELMVWNAGANTWTPLLLDPRLNVFSTYGRFNGLALHPQGILLFGEFDAINGVTGPVSNLVLYDPATGGVSDVPVAFDGPVKAALYDNGDLYVGGKFTVPFGRAARFDGSTWHGLSEDIAISSLNAGIAGVNTIEKVGSEIWLGGVFPAAFNTPGTSLSGTKGLVAYDPAVNTFRSIGGGVTSIPAVHGVAAIKEIGGDVYVGGQFNNIGGQSHTGMVRWDGTDYVSLGTGAFLATYDFACFPDSTGYCELVVGAENLFGEMHCPPVATEEVPLSAAIIVSPNPTGGLVNISWEQGFKPAVVRVLDARGREVAAYPVPVGNRAEVDFEGRPAGLYFLRLESASGRGVTKRVIRR